MNQKDLALFAIYVVYGSSFIFMSGAIWLYRERTAKLGAVGSMGILAVYALTHGVADLADAALRAPWNLGALESATFMVRTLFLVLSYLILLQFGLSTLLEKPSSYRYVAAGGMLVVFLVGVTIAQSTTVDATQALRSVERLARMLLALPAGLLAVVGFVRMAERCDEHSLFGCGRDSRLLAGAMGIYTVMTGAIPTGYPVSLHFIGLPIQFYRMLSAVLLTAAAMRFLRRFDVRV